MKTILITFLFLFIPHAYIYADVLQLHYINNDGEKYYLAFREIKVYHDEGTRVDEVGIFITDSEGKLNLRLEPGDYIISLFDESENKWLGAGVEIVGDNNVYQIKLL